MIIAAGDCAESDDHPPPRELSLAWLCRNYNSLPEAGGILDQSAETLYGMTAALTVYDAVRSYYRALYGPGDIMRWQRYHKRELEITGNWRKLRDAK